MAKNRIAGMHILTLLVVLFIGVFMTSCDVTPTATSQPTEPVTIEELVETIMAEKIKATNEVIPEPTVTKIFPTTSPTNTSTSIPTETPMPTQPPAPTQTPLPPTETIQSTSTATSVGVTELDPYKAGYSEQELLNAGYPRLTAPDGSFYYEGFFLSPSGLYIPIGGRIIRGSTVDNSNAGNTSGYTSTDPGSGNYSSPAVSQPGTSYSQNESYTPNYDPQPVVQNDGCDHNYDPCIPNIGKVTCKALGMTNIRVVGYDVYNLDRDNDGIACEN